MTLVFIIWIGHFTELPGFEKPTAYDKTRIFYNSYTAKHK